jgi:hypothetical protein
MLKFDSVLKKILIRLGQYHILIQLDIQTELGTKRWVTTVLMLLKPLLEPRDLGVVWPERGPVFHTDEFMK